MIDRLSIFAHTALIVSASLVTATPAFASARAPLDTWHLPREAGSWSLAGAPCDGLSAAQLCVIGQRHRLTPLGDLPAPLMRDTQLALVNRVNQATRDCRSFGRYTPDCVGDLKSLTGLIAVIE